MTTRKHFIAAAGIIRNQISDPAEKERVASYFADLFAQDSPQFDRYRFMTAATAEES